MDFKQFSQLIMIEQTLFALPFALLGVLFAGGGTWATWLWVAVALAAARTAGMAFNRVIDARIDARNPRTRDRLLPSGAVTPGAVWLTAGIASLVLIAAARALNPLCFYLSFPAVALLWSYSFFKRFSASAHFYLGFVEAAAPIGGYLAASGRFDVLAFVLGGVIMTWIAGLDIVYALQDLEFDRRAGLHSIPARLGRRRALSLSTACYAVSLAAMVWAGLLSGMQTTYWAAIVLVAMIFAYQQHLARRPDIAGSVRTFFKINAYVAPVLFLGTLADVVLL